MNFIDKIQSLPKKKRKIILWSVMFLVFVILLFFYIIDIQNTLARNQGFKLKDVFELGEANNQINQSKAIILGEFKKAINSIK